MRTFVLIPGAGGSPWCWSRVAPLLASAGHDVVAVDLPGDVAAAGLPDYVDEVLSESQPAAVADYLLHGE